MSYRSRRRAGKKNKHRAGRPASSSNRRRPSALQPVITLIQLITALINLLRGS